MVAEQGLRWIGECAFQVLMQNTRWASILVFRVCDPWKADREGIREGYDDKLSVSSMLAKISCLVHDLAIH